MDVNSMSPGSGRRIKENNTTINEADLKESELGQKGAEFISDTVAHNTSNVFTALQIIADANISAITTDSNASITGNALTGMIIPSGTVIYGRFKSITLSSGQILAYKGI